MFYFFKTLVFKLWHKDGDSTEKPGKIYEISYFIILILNNLIIKLTFVRKYQ